MLLSDLSIALSFSILFHFLTTIPSAEITNERFQGFASSQLFRGGLGTLLGRMADESPQTAEDQAQQPQPNPEIWKLLGRDTPAGKALFKLYNGDVQGKNVGRQYHVRNKQLHDKKIASGWTPKELDPPKPEYPRPQVAYPSFGHQRPGSGQGPNAARLQQIPHRRPGALIMKELEEEGQRMREAPPPMPKGPLLDLAEKERLADMMRFRGKLPEGTPEQWEEAARHRGVRPAAPRNEREELELLFDAVSLEVEERRTFLKDLERAGALKKDHVHQVRAEIQTRVDEMQRIDRMLKALE